ncbi:MAG: hypothetical protein B0W54_01210 [Cellvibrio sp. 79]|nr:MAG: hypothetical protein B0W54_01210 [Cellvibrio sp. 79]
MTIDVLFIHSAGSQFGDDGSAPFVKKLRASLGQNFNVNAPLMPLPDDPSYDRWRNKLKELLQHKSPPVLIGHSLGGSVLLKYISEEQPAISSVGLFLVATPFWGDENWNSDEFVLRENVANFLPDTLNIFLYQSRDDDVVSIDHLTRYSSAIPRAAVNELDGGGHVFKNGLPCLVEDIQRLAEKLELK